MKIGGDQNYQWLSDRRNQFTANPALLKPFWLEKTCHTYSNPLIEETSYRCRHV